MHQRSTPSHPDVSWKAKTDTLSFGSLADYWALLIRRKWTIAIVTVVVSAIVVAGSLLIPPTFTAQTTIMVKPGREFTSRSPAGQAPKSVLSVAEIINSEVEVLNSRELAEHVVSDMTVERLYPDMIEDPDVDPRLIEAAAVDRFRDDLVVMDVLESSIIRITFEHRSPVVAADALQLLVEKFKDKHLEIFSDRNTGFIADQLGAYERQLSASEDAFQAFRQANGLFDVDQEKSLMLNRRVALDGELATAEFRISELEARLEYLNGKAAAEPTTEPPLITEDRGSLVNRRGALSTELQQAEMRLAELRQQLVVIRGQLQVPGEPIAPVPGMQQPRSIDEAFIKLLDLQLEERQLLRNYAETSRQVVSVRQEIEVVDRFLRQRGAYLQQVIESTVREELDALLARRSTIVEQIELVDAALIAHDVRLVLDELGPLRARQDRIRQEIDEVSDAIETLTRYEKDFRQLDRRVSLDERNYELFRDTYEEARIMEELDRQKQVNIVVVERAAPPSKPSSLPKKLRIVLGAFVGLFAGLASAVLLELIKQT